VPVRGRAFAFALVAIGCVVAAAPAWADASLSRSRLHHRLTHQMQRVGGSSGAWVVDVRARRNRTLFSWASHTPRALASNTKLFTTAATLGRFGPGRRLTTTLYARRADAISGRTLSGDVAIVGAGDPALATSGFARRNALPLTPVAHLAQQVKGAGIRRITGDVRVDDTIFDRSRGVPTTGVDATGELSPLSGLSFDSGFVHGHYAKNPELVAARKLRKRLRAIGVHVEGGTGRADLRPNVLRRDPLASVASPPIKTLVAATNKPSNNFFAEMLLKRLAARPGTPGTTKRGARKAERFARKLGSSVQMENGSGLSRSDRTTPRELGRLLVAMRGGPAGHAFRRSLPVAGRDGTVAHRMNGTPAAGRCRTKTGTLIAVSALSGYCRAGHGLVAFSILMNAVNVDAARDAQDRMAALIARYRR
jgi:D-alanyl-D-alanine carboxypeptidase/D-alanyl-D-alanine-endopeptidase (penicillin-binding protein 4)